MTVDLLADEKVLYTKDYAKGRSRTRGTVIVTDKRVINTVEGKKSTERTEMKLDQIGGVTTAFKPASALVFVIGVIFAFIDVAFFVILNSKIGPFPSEQGYDTPIFAYIILGIYGLCALITIITGLIKMRYGLYVILCSKNKELNVVSATSISGRVKPIRLKTDKNSVKELANGISATLKNAKSA